MAAFALFLALLSTADRREFNPAELRLLDMNKGSLGELCAQLAKEPVAPLPVALVARCGVRLGTTEAAFRLPMILAACGALLLLLPLAERRGRLGIVAAAVFLPVLFAAARPTGPGFRALDAELARNRFAGTVLVAPGLLPLARNYLKERDVRPPGPATGEAVWVGVEPPAATMILGRSGIIVAGRPVAVVRGTARE